MTPTCSWEEAVRSFRDDPAQRELVRDCFYDDPIDSAARRFHATTEWQATRELLASHLPARVLDIGAGRGIASYAFAREGSDVTSLEPDPGDLVGRGAISELVARTGVRLTCCAGYGEKLPFAARSFDVVYGRAVLHHARDLRGLLQEVARVLRPGGRALFVREHVISRPADLAVFLERHPLHRLYGGEHAYPVTDYQAAFTAAGLRLRRVIGALESPLNYWPATEEQVREIALRRVGRWLGRPLSQLLWRSPRIRTRLLAAISRASRDPGRLHGFLGERP